MSAMARGPVDGLVKRWPTDLAVPEEICLAVNGVPLKITLLYCHNMTEILLKRT